MNFIDTIRALLRKGAPQDMKSARRRTEVLADLMRMNESMTRADIGAWRAAWQAAINVEDPQRRRLLTIYRDADIDSHLSGCVTQRTMSTLQRSFKLVNKEDGEEVREATELLESPWFKDLMRYALESIFWGHSLVQLGVPREGADGRPTYSCVTLVPRAHVVPEFGRVVRTPGDPWRTGIAYREDPYSEWLIECGSPTDLGLYLKAALQTIPKKNVSAFWDRFAEIFGMPIVVATTQSRDPEEHDRLQGEFRGMGSNQSIIKGPDTDLNFVETARSDAFNVYAQRADQCDREISKLILGQTMTIEDGSSLSQSETHLKVFQNILNSDADMIRDMVNGQLLPRMVAHGFPVEGLRFEWDEQVDYTPEQQVAFETMIADRYEVDAQYFAEKYNMPVGERINVSAPMSLKANKGELEFFV